MKVKVLNMRSYDTGNVESTFVFSEDTNLEEVTDILEKEYQENGAYYIDTLCKYFKDKMICVAEEKRLLW